MVDKEFCMSSYLVFRYIIDNNREFYPNIRHDLYKSDEEKIIYVKNVHDIDENITKQILELRSKKIGLLLSGGMDSACLASYLSGIDAYTFRFDDGRKYSDEIKRAQIYAERNRMNLHYVDVEWDSISKCLDDLMKRKGAPVHSIEPQLFIAAQQAIKDGVETLIIGDAADYVFGGMDRLYSKDWNYEEFIDRYSYVEPSKVLIKPVSMERAFQEYKCGNKIVVAKYLIAYFF